MQRATNDCGSESGASVQRGPDGAVRDVVCCDRCPSEATRESDSARLRWAAVAVGVGVSSVKMLTLCTSCMRSFRLWMLSTDIGATWERIVDEESRKAAAL